MQPQGYRPPAPEKPNKVKRQHRPLRKAAADHATGDNSTVTYNVPGAEPVVAKVQERKKKKRPLLKLSIVLITLLVVAAGGVYLEAAIKVSPYDNVFLPNISINGINLEGLTAAQAVETVRERAQAVVDGLSVQLVYDDRVYATITSDMVGLTYEESPLNQYLNEAWRIGHVGTVFQRKADLERVTTQAVAFSTGQTNPDTTRLDTLLLKVSQDLYLPAQDATATFDPQSAKYFLYTAESKGRQVDTVALKEEIIKAIGTMNQSAVAIPVTLLEPAVTEASLQADREIRKRVTTPIDKHSPEARTNNIIRAFQIINGTVVKPGETFSFNKVVGERTLENGFHPAIEYAYGEEVMGIGGGVCQASSTLYLASVMAGLNIVSREQHSSAVSYTPYGKDATVMYTKDRKIDFSFRNNTGKNIYIIARVRTDSNNRNQKYCEVTLCGESLGNVAYDLRTETKVLPAPSEIVRTPDKKHTYVTYKDEQDYLLHKAKDGAEVKAYLDKIENGELVETKYLYTDEYPAKAETYLYGTKSR